LITAIPAERRDRIQAVGYDYASQPRDAVTTCNLCRGTLFVGITHRDRYGYPAQAQACCACGLVCLSPRMTAEAYSRFYDGVYRPLVSAFHGRLIDSKTIQAEQREYAQERAELLRPFLGGAGLKTLLDIGGSTGVVAHHLAQEFGLSATLIDPAPLELEEARRLGLETITGLVEQYEFGYRTFDVVVICQTVDHLLDISGTLARVRHLLSGNGLLFIDIVDFRAAYLRGWSVEDAIKIDHPYYLTPETMSAYLKRAAFEVMRHDYAADHLHISYVCAPGAADPVVLPLPTHVDRLLREIRYVQNAPQPLRADCE
jgi:2-polyprenyl-3-methyl-5-hydroxy-6-metoxy-1,4-benzoquinol methylase